MAIASPVADLPSGRRVRDVYGDLWAIRDGRMVCLTARRRVVLADAAEWSEFAPFIVEHIGEEG